MRHVWTIAPDQERVELVRESGDEDAALRPTIDLIVTYADPGELKPAGRTEPQPRDEATDDDASS